MKINAEYHSYLKFVEEYYPKSSMIQANQKDVFKEILYHNFKAIKILDTYYYIDRLSVVSKSLIYDLKMYFVRLLYILPTNDFFFIDALLRSMAENLLRIVYSVIFPEVSYNSIKSLKYRDLWSEGIKTSTEFQEFNSMLSEINRIFSNKSLTVHSTQRMYSNHVDYLVDLMENDSQVSIKQLNSDIRSMFVFLFKELFSLFSLSDQDLTLQQSASLKSLS